MDNKKLMEKINDEWCDNEEHMGEQAALAVACEQNGKTEEWFYDNVHLIAVDPTEVVGKPQKF